MISNFFIIFFIILISFIPIVLWGYLFSVFGNETLNKKRFLAGIIGGAISVLPILYLEKIIDTLHLGFLNVFLFVKNIGENPFNFTFSLFSLIVFILFLSIAIGFFFKGFSRGINIFLRNLFIFLVFSFFISIIIYFLNSINFLSQKNLQTSSISFGKTIFDSFKLMIFYYILVGILEEISKHFNFLQTSFLHITNLKQGILYSVFVALGFSFIENILYFYNIYNVYGLSSTLVSTYFLRSIFSVFVHIFSSFIIGYYFTKAYLDFKEKKQFFDYIKIFLFGLFFGILLHSIFDISLSLGFSLIIFLYFIGGYFYMGNILLKKIK